MARNYFDKKKPLYLSACANRDADRSLVTAFKAQCKAQGISTQEGILRACRDYLSELYGR